MAGAAVPSPPKQPGGLFFALEDEKKDGKKDNKKEEPEQQKGVEKVEAEGPGNKRGKPH